MTGSASAGTPSTATPPACSGASNRPGATGTCALALHVRSGTVLAHIRATSGSAVQQTNCHPFRHRRWLWMHNGLLAGFTAMKRDLTLAVDPELYPFIEGSTVSPRCSSTSP